MHRCPDCGERFEGNICTFCGRPVPQEELEQEKAVQEKSDEQANINNSEEVSKSAVENTALNSAGVQPVNEYAQKRLQHAVCKQLCSKKLQFTA